MHKHPLSQLYLPNIDCPDYSNWGHMDPQPVSLKQLSHNLTLLQQQYNKIQKRGSSPSTKRIKISSIPIRKTHQRQNSQLPRIITYNEGIDSSFRKKRRSNSNVKQMSAFLNKQNQVFSVGRKRDGKEFSQLRGLLPLQGKEEKVFLHKHRMMNISRALNLNRIRNRTTHKTLAFVFESQTKETQQAELADLSPRVQRLM